MINIPVLDYEVATEATSTQSSSSINSRNVFIFTLVRNQQDDKKHNIQHWRNVYNRTSDNKHQKKDNLDSKKATEARAENVVYSQQDKRNKTNDNKHTIYHQITNENVKSN